MTGWDSRLRASPGELALRCQPHWSLLPSNQQSGEIACYLGSIFHALLNCFVLTRCQKWIVTLTRRARPGFVSMCLSGWYLLRFKAAWWGAGSVLSPPLSLLPARALSTWQCCKAYSSAGQTNHTANEASVQCSLQSTLLLFFPFPFLSPAIGAGDGWQGCEVRFQALRGFGCQGMGSTSPCRG